MSHSESPVNLVSKARNRAAQTLRALANALSPALETGLLTTLATICRDVRKLEKQIFDLQNRFGSLHRNVHSSGDYSPRSAPSPVEEEINSTIEECILQTRGSRGASIDRKTSAVRREIQNSNAGIQSSKALCNARTKSAHGDRRSTRSTYRNRDTKHNVTGSPVGSVASKTNRISSPSRNGLLEASLKVANKKGDHT